MTLEEIKRTVTMQDVLAKYGLHPNRAGFIRCPFHNEKTASMKIWKDSFRCFGCGKHGDVVDFVAEMDGVNFSEAFASLGGTTSKKMTDIHSFILHRNALEREKKKKGKDFRIRCRNEPNMGEIQRYMRNATIHRRVPRALEDGAIKAANRRRTDRPADGAETECRNGRIT